MRPVPMTTFKQSMPLKPKQIKDKAEAMLNFHCKKIKKSIKKLDLEYVKLN